MSILPTGMEPGVVTLDQWPVAQVLVVEGFFTSYIFLTYYICRLSHKHF